MAIIRYPDRYEKTLLPLLKLRELSYETLYKFELVVIMSERHPLAKTSVLTQDLLSQAVEIVCDDTSLCTYLHESPDADHNENSIHIHERGSQFDFLTGVPGTFMFVSRSLIPSCPDTTWFRKIPWVPQENDGSAHLSGGLQAFAGGIRFPGNAGRNLCSDGDTGIRPGALVLPGAVVPSLPPWPVRQGCSGTSLKNGIFLTVVRP
ncbi:MAG: hypothetical protein ACLVAW_15215 [Eisenbergiella massiliensis]